MVMDNFSFKKGYFQLSLIDVPDFKKKIMDKLSIRTRQSFHLRLNGEIEPKVSEARAIEEVFSEYGITDVWGDGTSK